MLRKIKIYALAESDIETGISYYSAQQKGLGSKFKQRILSALKKIQQHPSSATFAHNDIRYKLVEKFPYIILYEFDERYIYILRIFNTHQSPLNNISA